MFNGKYSTSCYVDEVLAAMRDLFARLPGAPAAFLRQQAAIFLHRPYQRMAETGLSISYLLALALGDAADQNELAGYATTAGVDVAALKAELIDEHPELGPEPAAAESHPLATQTTRVFRKSKAFTALMTTLGTSAVGRVGNLYTASLPLWLAAGLEEAAAAGLPLQGQLLTIGYGSGDAAEVIPLTLVPDWEVAARRSAVNEALQGPIAVDKTAYEALHDGQHPTELAPPPGGRFVIDRIGERKTGFNDLGIEYYRYEQGVHPH